MSRAPASLDQPTLPDALLARVRSEPAATALVIVRPDRPDERVSAAGLLARADRFARALGSRLDSAPAVVSVCLYHGLDLHAAFLGAMLAGHIPTMIAPPSPRMEPNKYIDSFERMLAHIRPGAVVTDPGVITSLRERRASVLEGQQLLDPGEIVRDLADRAPDAIDHAARDPDVPALLQHSSGTTGLQKGIALSHRAILCQLRNYARAIGLGGDDVVATWLPLYHDMGLVACFLLPILSGTPIVQMSPFDWVLRPAMLLQKIAEHRATLCWLPNFAYAFMARSVRASQLDEVDLSGVRAFVNCSEPVMAASHDAFLERFRSVGARETQLTACYAMAENVFAVTQSPLGQAPRSDRIARDRFQTEHRALPSGEPPFLELVSNGRAIDDVEIRIVGDDDRPLAEREVGEICVRGTSLFDGYFGREDLTRAAFLDDWYRTGDLGYTAEGELFVTGRKKDLIIIQGRNFYPTDLEAAVSELPGVSDGRVAAFGDADPAAGTEMLVVVAETEIEDEAEKGRLKLAIMNHIAQSFDCTATRVYCVPPRWMVKSTAGKVARADNFKKYEAQLKS